MENKLDAKDVVLPESELNKIIEKQTVEADENKESITVVEIPIFRQEEIDDLNNKIKSLSDDNQELKQKIANLEKQKSDILKNSDKLSKKESDLANKEFDLIAKEQNAINDFAVQKQSMLESFKKEKSELESQLLNLKNSASELKQKMISDELTAKSVQEEKLQRAFQVKIEQQDKELIDRQNRFESDLNNLKETHNQMLSTIQNDLLAEKNKFQELNSELEKKLIEVAEQQSDLNFSRDMLKADKANLGQQIEERVSQAVLNMQNKIVLLERHIEELNDDLKSKSDLIKDLQTLQRRFGNQSPEEIIRSIKEKDTEIERLCQELSLRPSEIDGKKFEMLKKTNESLNRDYLEVSKAKMELESERHKYLMSVGELEKARQEKDFAERRREAVSATVAEYQSEVTRLKAVYEKPKEQLGRIAPIEKPLPDFKLYEKRLDVEVNEIEWLNKITQDCKESGINFSNRIIYSFHTCLKTSEWSPLTVLAGVSGTGKSELPRLYALFGGMLFIPLSVQPNWDSTQSLFGYFNSVDNAFNATELLRAMVQMSKSKDDYPESMNDSMLLCLLDEMNLSYVELYFSDLLSKLETRRGQDSIALDVDLGAGFDKYKLNLSKNVLWTGTMNEDETTKTLSDKVLDRANLLSFPRPEKFVRRTTPKLKARSKLISKTLWNNWLSASVLFEESLIEPYKVALEEINGRLEKVGRALGHRVWQSIENYMSNYPLIIAEFAKEERDDAEISKFMQIAFEDQLVQKVMPKLRGIETSGKSKTECLEPITKIITDHAPGIINDFTLAKQSGHGVFVWNNSKYLETDI